MWTRQELIVQAEPRRNSSRSKLPNQPDRSSDGPSSSADSAAACASSTSSLSSISSTPLGAGVGAGRGRGGAGRAAGVASPVDGLGLVGTEIEESSIGASTGLPSDQEPARINQRGL